MLTLVSAREQLFLRKEAPIGQRCGEKGVATIERTSLVRSFLLNLRRITTTGNFVPEIDGLRFIAISSVVLYHINGYLLLRNHYAYTRGIARDSQIFSIFTPGALGVQLFFVISGLVLGMPFASWLTRGGKAVSLRSYFLRRLTRLEPPYILTLLVLFCGATAISKIPRTELFHSLLASLCYTHNLFWPREVPPLVNGVAWTLEIEVQFYILAPLLAQVFRLRPVIRRGLLVALIAIKCVLFRNFAPSHASIIEYYDYFMAGFLLADLYVSGAMKPAKYDVGWFLLAVALFGVIWAGAPVPKSITMALFYFAAFRSKSLASVLAQPIISAIGGMCYSIYLVHMATVSFAGRLVVRQITHWFMIDYAIEFLGLLFVVSVASVITYKLLEQPCMRRDWPQRLVQKLRYFSRNPSSPTSPCQRRTTQG